MDFDNGTSVSNVEQKYLVVKWFEEFTGKSAADTLRWAGL
jgi:hypothetical protein